MKRVFVALLVFATVLAVFVAVAVHMEKGQRAEIAGEFFGLLWDDPLHPGAHELTDPGKFMDFHPPETLRPEFAEWKRLLGAYRGLGEQRGTVELAPDRQRVVVQLVFDNGTAEGSFVFQEIKGAHKIVRFSFELAPDTALPADPDAALPTAYAIGDSLRAGQAPQVWALMSYELQSRIGGLKRWFESLRGTFGDLVGPADPEAIEPFALDKDDPTLFKGVWKTKYENGTLWVRMTLRWVDVSWRLDDIEVKRLDQ